jgi:hypothetical protein
MTTITFNETGTLIDGPVTFTGNIEGVNAYFRSDLTVGGELQASGPVYCGTTVTVGADQSPDPSAILDIISEDKGVLFPRMTKDQRRAIQNPADGLTVYQTGTGSGLYLHDAGVWRKVPCIIAA